MALYSTLQKFITKEGAPVEGASVNVKLSGGAVDAELFATRTGTAKGNPFLTTANGEALCYVKAGRYDMTVTKGTDQIVFKDIEAGPVSNVGTFAEGGTITDPDQLVEDADGNKWRWTGNLNYKYAAGENPNSISEWVRYIGFGLPSFKTIAAMKAYSNLKYFLDGTRVEWQGYYAQSDGGGNWGVLRFGAHEEDGGSIFSIDNNTYIEANLKGKSINVLKFGARGNGTSDNTDAFKSAIDASSYDVGVYVPGGNYMLKDFSIVMNSATGRKNLKLVGDGVNRTVLFFDNAAGNDVITVEATMQFWVELSSLRAVAVTSKLFSFLNSRNYGAPRLIIDKVRLDKFKKGLSLFTWVSQISNVVCSECEVGFEYVSGTSITGSGLYAIDCDYGHIFGAYLNGDGVVTVSTEVNDGFLTYSDMSNLASDRSTVADYTFGHLIGLTLSGLGSEGTKGICLYFPNITKTPTIYTGSLIKINNHVSMSANSSESYIKLDRKDVGLVIENSCASTSFPEVIDASSIPGDYKSLGITLNNFQSSIDSLPRNYCNYSIDGDRFGAVNISSVSNLGKAVMGKEKARKFVTSIDITSDKECIKIPAKLANSPNLPTFVSGRFSFYKLNNFTTTTTVSGTLNFHSGTYYSGSIQPVTLIVDKSSVSDPTLVDVVVEGDYIVLKFTGHHASNSFDYLVKAEVYSNTRTLNDDLILIDTV